MDDNWEARWGLDPAVDDSGDDADGDGLTNLEEYLLGLNPANPDCDGDGLPDGLELSVGMDPHRNDLNDDNNGNSWANIFDLLFGLDPNAAPPTPELEVDLATGDVITPGNAHHSYRACRECRELLLPLRTQPGRGASRLQLPGGVQR